MAWKLISKLAKNQMINREHLIIYWPDAIRQISSLFGMTSSERIPTIVQFLSSLMQLRDTELPLSDKIHLVELVLSKVHEQMTQATDDQPDNCEPAYKSLCSFFQNVTNLFTNLLTATGRNSRDLQRFSQLPNRASMNHRDNDYGSDDDTPTEAGQLASQLLTPD